MTLEEKRRRVTTKYMCGWCAMCPRNGSTGHTRCSGYDEKSGKGCLCAAYDHTPHAKVVAHQARFNHVTEEVIREWWKQQKEGEESAPTTETEGQADSGG